MKWRVPGLWAAILFSCAFPAFADDVEFEKVLLSAEAARTANRERYANSMEVLAKLPSPESRVLQDRYKLLKVYPLLMGASPKEAFPALRELAQSASDADVRFRAGTLLANSYAIVSDFAQALRVLEEILPDRLKVKSREALQTGLASAAIVYNQVGAYKLGRQYASEIVDHPSTPRNLCAARNLLIEADRGEGRRLESSGLVAAVEACKDEPIFLGFTRSYIACSLHAEGRLQQATAYLERYLPVVEATGYPRLIGEYRTLLAKYRLEAGDRQAAEAHALKATSKLSEGGSEAMASAYQVLYKVAEERGDTALAFERFRKFAEADRAHLSDVRAKEFAYQVVRQEIFQKSQQIESLNQQNQLLQLQQQVDKQSAQNARLVVLLMLLVCGFVSYWAYKVKRVQMSLRRWAETDALTHVSNRHSFSQSSREVLGEAARDGEEVAMVMFDLDHFKSINDRFGHGTGDWVLKEVAEVCRGFCRRVDKIGRLGGEEFAFLLRGYDARSAVRLSDDCRARLASIETEPSGHNFVVTGSFGVTTTALSGYDLTRLLSHADSALYRAKREGRNRVYLYEASTVTVEAQLVEGTADNVVPLKLEPAVRA
jgi:diguanylate cyclase (GGDEF)-like protein